MLHFNSNRYRLEVLLFKLEILDHKARERAGAITPTFIGPVPVLLQLDTAMEVKPHIGWKLYWACSLYEFQLPMDTVLDITYSYKPTVFGPESSILRFCFFLFVLLAAHA